MDDPGVLERFLREIRSVARLRHPNIVTAHHATRFSPSVLFAMEYVEGLDLFKLVKAEGPMPVADASHFIHQAALGLQHAHEEGLVHRDIKPHNLMLSRKGDKATVKILDFGLAKAAREEKVEGGLTSTGQALGTPDYIAPEQIRDAPTADIRADIYSLGGTLYYLLTGRPPYQEKSLYDLYQAHISRNADSLNLVRPEVPVELASLVAKMMAKDPSQRFQTPGEVAQALTPFFKFREQDRSREAEPQVAPRGRPPWVWPSVAVGVLILGLFVAWMGGVFLRVKTPEGDLVFSDLPEQAVVTVDGRIHSVEWPGGKGPAIVTVPAGEHRVKVELNGVDVYGEEVSIATGRTKWITVRLEPRPAPGPGKERAGNNVPESEQARVAGAESRAPRQPQTGASKTPPQPPSEVPNTPISAPLTVSSAPPPTLVPGRDSIVTNSIGMKLVLIPSGEFLMGSPDSDKGAQDDEKPQHRVQITRPFYLGATEVTQGQYRAVMGQSPSFFEGLDDLPVEQVSWTDAIAFCDKLSALEKGQLGGTLYRLPTEAEWEYACRAGSTTRYGFGDDAARLGEFAWYDGNSGEKTHPVGGKRSNAFNLYDMHGNVWEWCQDWFDKDYYGQSLGADPPGPARASVRVVRGGSWDNFLPRNARSAFRVGSSPANRYFFLGFRLARVQSGR